MNQQGIANTYALKGGTQGWKVAGYPMEGSGQITLQPNAAPNPPAATNTAH
jgi:hypothetical protein